MALIQPCQAMWAMCLAINLFSRACWHQGRKQPWHWNMLPYLNRIWWTLQMRQGWAKVCQWLSMFVCKKHSDYTTLTTWPHWIPLVPKDTKGTLDSMGTVRRPLVSPWKDAKAISGPWCTCCNRGLALHPLPWYVPLHSLPMFSNVYQCLPHGKVRRSWTYTVDLSSNNSSDSCGNGTYRLLYICCPNLKFEIFPHQSGLELLSAITTES